MPKFPRPRIVLKQVLELPPEGEKAEIVYLEKDKHPYIYQKQNSKSD